FPCRASCRIGTRCSGTFMNILRRKMRSARCWTTGSSSQDCSACTNGLRRNYANPGYSTWCATDALVTRGLSSIAMCGNRRVCRESSAHFDASSQFADHTTSDYCRTNPIKLRRSCGATIDMDPQLLACAPVHDAHLSQERAGRRGNGAAEKVGD